MSNIKRHFLYAGVAQMPYVQRVLMVMILLKAFRFFAGEFGNENHLAENFPIDGQDFIFDCIVVLISVPISFFVRSRCMANLKRVKDKPTSYKFLNRQWSTRPYRSHQFITTCYTCVIGLSLVCVIDPMFSMFLFITLAGAFSVLSYLKSMKFRLSTARILSVGHFAFVLYILTCGIVIYVGAFSFDVISLFTVIAASRIASTNCVRGIQLVKIMKK